MSSILGLQDSDEKKTKNPGSSIFSQNIGGPPGDKEGKIYELKKQNQVPFFWGEAVEWL